LQPESEWRTLKGEGETAPEWRFSMRYLYSAQLREDLNSQILAALRSRGMVNIARVAEDVRLRNLEENIALEDVERLVMQTAQLYGAAMELDGLTAVQAGQFASLAGNRDGSPGLDLMSDQVVPSPLLQG
jgi:hypothetical protein